jgi:hypothetical protein
MSFAFVVLNASATEEQLLIRAEEVRAPAALQQLGAAMHCEAAAFGRQALGAIGLSWGRERVLQAEERRDALHGGLVPARAAGGVVAAKGRAPATDTMELTLEPGEARQAVLHVSRSRDAAEGDLNAIRITQSNAEGEVRGGLTVVVRA